MWSSIKRQEATHIFIEKNARKAFFLLILAHPFTSINYGGLLVELLACPSVKSAKPQKKYSTCDMKKNNLNE